MKKLLIISYYWPPSGGAGVQRWLKFVKYLRRFGWEPVVYTPENPEAPADDPSLEKDIPEGLMVVKTKIWEPYAFYKKFTGRKKYDKIKVGLLSENKVPTRTENLSVWIRGNLFIPDARKYWIKPSIKYLKSWLNSHPVDALVSTGPPHSMHRIAQALHTQLNIPWLADFRDPWTSIDFYHELKLSHRSDRLHHRMEKQVLEQADRVLVVSNGMLDDFMKIHQRDYLVIPNGFDDEDTTGGKAELHQKFSIAHIGSMGPARNPLILWQALKELVAEQKEFAAHLEVDLLGQVDHSVREQISSHGLDKFIRYIPYMQHDEVVQFQKKVQVLLLVINQTPNAHLVVTGKIFEYINSGRPIINIGPVDGDAADIINETNTRHSIAYEDVSGLKKIIHDQFLLFLKGENKVNAKNVENYSRLNLTRQLGAVLDEML